MALMARSLLALRLAVILALATSFVGPAAALDVNVGVVTPEQVTAQITPMTSMVQLLVPTATAVGTSLIGNTLTPTLSGPLLDVLKGLQSVSNLLTIAVTALKSEGAVAATDACKVSTAFLQFAVAEQQLVAILISKASLFSTVPSVVQPVVPVLQQVQTLGDSLGYTLKAIVQTSQTDVDAITAAGASLHITFTIAANAFNLAKIL